MQYNGINPSRAYNMILVDRDFANNGNHHCYALLGLERATGRWTLLGGKIDGHETAIGGGARELCEESSRVYDFTSQQFSTYWNSLPTYEYGKHKVFVHGQTLSCDIQKLNKAATDILNTNWPHDYKEIKRYQLIKLNDFINLAWAQKIDGNSGFYNHPKEAKPMKIEGWVLYTLKYADKSALRNYMY